MKGETVNAAEGGMVVVMGEPIRWWSNPRFRLVPHGWHRPEDKYNRADWGFDWLGLTVWTMMSPDIGASIKLDDQGLEFRIYPPYLIVSWKLPLFPWRWHQKLWRTARGYR